MKKNKIKSLKSDFEKDVLKGLSSYPKYLDSKYIYDQKGDKLFQQIMHMPEYYLTRCEYEIINTHQKELCSIFDNKAGFDLIELGAGDGKKTKVILEGLLKANANFTYLPIDISLHSLEDLQERLLLELPDLHIEPLQGSYFKVLKRLKRYIKRKKVLLVLGSNIGNLNHKKAILFLKNIQKSMQKDDLLFMGFDQKKDPQVILNAYNDAAGITAEFNKNLLHRINKQLDANFNVDQFKHWETYNPETGTAKSFLVCQEAQQVHIKKLDLAVNFEAYESIHCEISQKYDDATVAWLADKAGLEIVNTFTDQRAYYKNYIFKKKAGFA